MTRTRFLPALILSALFAVPMAFADGSAFHPGPVIADYGNVASIESDQPIPEDTEFKIRFDVAKQADAGTLNRNLVTAARFLNMHVEAGVPIENIDLAIVIHGGATHDVTSASHYGAVSEDAENANAGLIEALTGKGVRIYVCGQSAAYHDVSKADLLPGVQMSLSALTAHALLDDEGYALNPF